VQTAGGGEIWRVLTFFSAGSVTPSASLLRALRICEAATLVEVFSKACQRCDVSGSRQRKLNRADARAAATTLERAIGRACC